MLSKTKPSTTSQCSLSHSEASSSDLPHPRHSLSSTATGLKLRLQDLTVVLDGREEEIAAERSELTGIKNASPVVALDAQTNDIRTVFASDMSHIEDDFKLQVNLQKAENVRIHQALNQLKVEKTAVHQQLLAIQRRIEAVEEELGHE